MTDYSNRWAPLQCVAFRFATVFFFLNIFPFPLSSIPGIHMVGQWYEQGKQALVVWVAENVLRLPEAITVFRSGSGDKTYDFVFLFVAFSLSLLVTLVWSVIDRERTEYTRFLYWVRVGVRYYLGMMMVVYGMSKVFHLQMPSPRLFQLVQPFGDKSPMGLAWSYVGYSEAFSMFTGLAEVLGGVLLFFRRTTTLGALLVAAVMCNVAVMNFCFYIPVKLYSILLFVMAVFLVLPDADRLLHILVWNQPTQPRLESRYLHKKWMRISAVVVKVLFIGAILIGNITSSMKMVGVYGDKRPQAPLYGIYYTETFVLNGDTLAPLTTDVTRWRQFITESPDYVHVKFMNDSLTYFPVSWDTTAHKITLNSGQGNEAEKAIFRYREIADTLELSGTLKQDTVKIRLRKRDLNSFRLIGTGFRWIQEYPYNR